jgi:hypothetical protein
MESKNNNKKQIKDEKKNSLFIFLFFCKKKDKAKINNITLKYVKEVLKDIFGSNDNKELKFI